MVSTTCKCIINIKSREKRKKRKRKTPYLKSANRLMEPTVENKFICLRLFFDVKQNQMQYS